jgi:hypothetical protein
MSSNKKRKHNIAVYVQSSNAGAEKQCDEYT